MLGSLAEDPVPLESASRARRFPHLWVTIGVFLAHLAALGYVTCGRPALPQTGSVPFSVQLYAAHRLDQPMVASTEASVSRPAGGAARSSSVQPPRRLTIAAPRVKVSAHPLSTKTAALKRSASVEAALPVTESAPDAALAPSVKMSSVDAEPAFTEAEFGANYLEHPVEYPKLSRRFRETGTVWLKVRIDRHGAPIDIQLSKSSGYARLDNGAVEAVSRWQFKPARKGDEPIETSVIVPINFRQTPY